MNQPLKLAVVTETYPPEVNGVARTIGMMVNELCERKYDIHVFRPRQPGEVGKIVPGNFTTYLSPGLILPFYPEVRMGLPLYRYFTRAWRKNPPDLVHVVTEGPLGWAAVRAAVSLDVPVVSDFHTNFHTYSKYYGAGVGRPWINRYLRRFHNRTLSTMVPTKALKLAMAEDGYERLAVVGRGVDTQLFSPKRRHHGLRERWNCGPGDPVCLYVGRLAAEKNLDLVMDAFDAFKRGQPRAKMVLVGDGPWRDKLRQKLPEAIFAGVRRGESLARYYASADLFLFPSLSETFGNVTMEAMASGLAVLAFDVAAAGTYIQDGVNGTLVDAQNTASFVDRAAALARNSAMWLSLGKKARETAAKCTWSDVVDDLENVFFKALNAKGKLSCSATG